MKILISTIFREEKLRAYYDHFYRWLIKNINRENVDVKILLPERLYAGFHENNEMKAAMTPVLITSKDLEKIFGEDLSEIVYHQKFYITGLNDGELERFKILTRTVLGSWYPDIVLKLGYFSSRKIWNDIFPNALCLTQENGIFSRPPFFRTLTYDPYSALQNNFMNTFADDIKNLKITPNQDKSVNKFKKQLTRIIDSNSNINKELKYYKKRFKKLVLLPLTSDYMIKIFKEDFIYNSELELIKSVMENMPTDIGVFVTQHSDLGTLTQQDIEYFSSKYKNFIYLQKTDGKGFFFNSLFYFKHVDAVINLTSKTGLMAMLWDKPILSLAKISNELIKDGQGVEDLEKVLNTPYKNKNNIIYWYFTRYLLLEPDFNRQDYMYEYLMKKLKYYKEHGIDFGYFDEVNNFEEASETIVNHLKIYYQPAYIKAFLEVIKEIKTKITEIQTKIKNKIQNKVQNKVQLIIKKTKMLYIIINN